MKPGLRFIAALLWAFLIAPATGQHANGWTNEVLQARIAKAAATLPMERRAIEMGSLYSNYYLDQAWDTSIEGRSNAIGRPNVKFTLEGESLVVANGEILLPASFFFSMSSLALIVGHDASFYDDLSPATAPGILGHPIGNLQFLSQVDNTGLFRKDASVTVMFSQYLNCVRSAGSCASSQVAAQFCGFVFLFGHEISHVLTNQHMPDDGAYPIEDELAADKEGLRVLRRIIERNDVDDPVIPDDASRNACLAMPAAFLEVNERSARSSLKESFARRKEAYLAALDDARNDVEDLTKLQESSSGIGTLQIDAPRDASLVTVDGIQVEPEDAAALTLLTGSHVVSIVSSSGFASGRVVVRGARTVVYAPDPLPFNQSSETKLMALVARQSWTAVVAGSADADLRPTDPACSAFLWKALHALKLDAWIQPAPGQELSREARRWKTRALTGATWSDAFLDSVLTKN